MCREKWRGPRTIPWGTPHVCMIHIYVANVYMLPLSATVPSCVSFSLKGYALRFVWTSFLCCIGTGSLLFPLITGWLLLIICARESLSLSFLCLRLQVPEMFNGMDKSQINFTSRCEIFYQRRAMKIQPLHNIINSLFRDRLPSIQKHTSFWWSKQMFDLTIRGNFQAENLTSSLPF